jgi:membrane-anchored glycerophosphoryl diester phosphodiesterase (GDPDase)
MIVVWHVSGVIQKLHSNILLTCSYLKLMKGAVSFQLRFPFVICSVSILVETASSATFMHEPLLPGFWIELEG